MRKPSKISSLSFIDAEQSLIIPPYYRGRHKVSITEKSLHMCKRIDVKTFRDHKEIQPGLDAGSEAMRFCYTAVFLNTNFLSK